MISQHLAAKGVDQLFYFRLFDEPAEGKVNDLIELCDWIHQQERGGKLNVMLTSNKDNEAKYVGAIDVFVPHADVFDPVFGQQRKDAGNQYWQYTCVGTFDTRYPDSWKLDFYGTGHRALGWWLYKYGAQGYLYWGVDWWSVNPWEDAQT